MRKTGYKIIAVVLIMAFLPVNVGQVFGQEEYKAAVRAARAGDMNAAFLYFHFAAHNDPNPKQRESALFAVGEYYFLNAVYKDSFDSFTRFVNTYPDSKMKLFALGYLYRIAQKWQKEDQLDIIQKEITGPQRIILIFKKTREHSFKSPLGIKHKLVHYIDKLEFYVDGELQAQIPL